MLRLGRYKMNKYQESLNFFMCADGMPSSITYEEIKNIDGETVLWRF